MSGFLFNATCRDLIMCQQIIRYGAITFLSLALSIGSVIVAVVFDLKPSYGTRGGALAVAISFAVLFVSRPHETFQNIKKEHDKFGQFLTDMKQRVSPNADGNTSEQALKECQERLANVEELWKILIEKDEGDQNLLTVFLTASSVVGTLFWGFGDWFVCWIEAGKVYLPPS